MKLVRMFLLFVSIFFITSNIFSQREDIMEQMRNVTHNPMDHLPKETLSQDAILNDMLNRTSKINVLATAGVVDSAIATSSDGSITKHKYGFDSNGNMTLELIESWDGNNWVNFNQFSYTYDSNGNMTSDLFERWFDTYWKILARDTYTYDSNGNMTSHLRESYDGVNLVNSRRETYTYDSNENMTSDLREDWEGTNWVGSYRSSYTYDTNGNRTSNLRQSWDGANWANIVLYTYTYDSNGNMTLYSQESWDGVNIVLYTYTYDSNGNMTLYLLESWDGTNWVIYWRETYTYDSNGNMTSYLNELWDGTNLVLTNGNLSFLDSFGNNYSIDGGEIKIFYRTITEVNETKFGVSSFSISQNYPNPFNPSTTISYSLPQSGLVQLKVYDLLGREVAALVNKEQSMGSYKIEFNASNLTSGVYFYRFQSGSFVETKKLILLR